MVPRSGRVPVVVAIVVLAAAAAVLVVLRPGPAPERTVQVVVSGAGPVAPQQPGIAYGGAGHMVPSTRQSSTARQTPTDAALVLTTPSGQTRRSGQTLPWRRTISLRPGQQVSVSVRSATATSLECTITVDGNQVAKQQSGTPGTVTCRARS